MDPWRTVYQLIRFYVWALVVLGLFTVGLLVVPQGTPDPRLAGVWFAVGGFGSLVVLTLFILFLLRSP